LELTADFCTMQKYWAKTPQWLKKLFPAGLVWDVPDTGEPTIYLTFDDGPHPTATPFVLDQLAAYNAKASFFCVGNNVSEYPEVFDRIKAEGHAPGNHTYNHLNGWHTDNDTYLSNINKANELIGASLFRPPYGRIRLSQIRKLRQAHPQWRVVMWDVLSGDFDTTITPEQCLHNVISNVQPGSIIVFHDSDKAWPRLSDTLPKVLEYCAQQDWQLKALP